jgi:hypothetical protein
LVEIDQNNMFELKDVKAARLWMLPPVAMEVLQTMVLAGSSSQLKWRDLLKASC